MNWKTISKFDSHVHILPEKRQQGFIKYQGEYFFNGTNQNANGIKR